VDFVVKIGRNLVAIEVKCGQRREALSGIDAFVTAFKPQRTLLVGADGIAIDTFLSTSVRDWS